MSVIHPSPINIILVQRSVQKVSKDRIHKWLQADVFQSKIHTSFMIFWRLKSLFNNPFLSLEVLKHFYNCVKQTKKGEAYENSKGATNVSNHVRYGYFGIFCYSPNFIFIKIDPNQSCFQCFFYPNRWL